MNVIYCDICGKEIPEKDDRYIAGKDLCDECEAALRQLMSGEAAEKVRGLTNIFKTSCVNSIAVTTEGFGVDMDSGTFFEMFGDACKFNKILGCNCGHAIHVEGDVVYDSLVFEREYDKVKAGKESVQKD